MGIFSKFFSGGEDKHLKRIQPLVAEINNLEAKFKDFSAEEMRDKTTEFRTRLDKGESLDDLLPEAFALVREAAKKTLQQRHYDVQLIGGIILHQGRIAEMKTGEGKTLASTLTVYLNALEQKGVHVITVNDYLTKRDMVWMGQVYHLLGLSVGCIVHESAYLYDPSLDKEKDEERDLTGSFKVIESYLKPVPRKEAYQADITYGTNNEFGFDYLRDNMVYDLETQTQRGLNYAIIDEVDSM